MNRLRLLLALVAILTVGWVQTAAAEVKVTFYTHGWGVGANGVTYFPHAFIRVEGTPTGGEAVDRTFGFTATDLSTAMTDRPGIVKPVNGDGYLEDSTPHFSVIASDDQYRALLEKITWWMTPEGATYNLKRRNCIHFVAEMAALVGLTPGTTKTLKPGLFMSDTIKKNAGKLTLINATAKPEAPAPVDVDALEKAGS
ncbi:MAG: hypothetical protein V4466_11390 [Pseudomonadota bacterium]